MAFIDKIVIRNMSGDDLSAQGPDKLYVFIDQE